MSTSSDRGRMADDVTELAAHALTEFDEALGDLQAIVEMRIPVSPGRRMELIERGARCVELVDRLTEIAGRWRP